MEKKTVDRDEIVRRVQRGEITVDEAVAAVSVIPQDEGFYNYDPPAIDMARTWLEIKTAWMNQGSPPHAGTQAATVQVVGPTLMGLGHVVNGQVFKPDANPKQRGPCGRCGKPGVWISGASEFLCARHQDDY